MSLEVSIAFLFFLGRRPMPCIRKQVVHLIEVIPGNDDLQRWRSCLPLGINAELPLHPYRRDNAAPINGPPAPGQEEVPYADRTAYHAGYVTVVPIDGDYTANYYSIVLMFYLLYGLQP
jgi:hypothetical protein